MILTLENMTQEDIEERLPEFGELSEQRIAEESNLHNLAEAYEDEKRKRVTVNLKKKKAYSLVQLYKDRKIVRFIEQKRIDIQDNNDMVIKQYFWKNIYCHKRLRISAGNEESSFVSIEKCDNPNRLTSAVRRVYECAKRRFDEYLRDERTLNSMIPFETF